MGDSDPKQCKLVIVGDSGTGKTSFIHRHTTGDFLKEYTTTPDVEIHSLVFDSSVGLVQFDAWEVPGHVSDRVIEQYQSTQCGIIMFDVTSRKSYRNVSRWFQNLSQFCTNIPIALVGTKIDTDCRNVKASTVTFHRKKQSGYFEISTKNSCNIEEPFLWLAMRLFGSKRFADENGPGPPRWSRHDQQETVPLPVKTPWISPCLSSKGIHNPILARVTDKPARPERTEPSASPASLSSIPRELIDAVIHLLLPTDFTELTKGSEYKTLSMINKSFRDRVLAWFEDHEVTVRLQKLKRPGANEIILRRLSSIRIDLSDMDYRERTSPDQSIDRLFNVLKGGILRRMTFFIPPRYSSLPLYERDTRFDRFLGPLYILANKSVRITWDPHDITGPADEEDMSVFNKAAFEGRADLVEHLLPSWSRQIQGNADHSHPAAYCTSMGYNALHYAAMRGHTNVLKMLMATKIFNVNATAGMNETSVLGYAVQSGREDTVEVVLQDRTVDLWKGSTYTGVGYSNETPLDMAELYRFPSIALRLRAAMRTSRAIRRRA